MFIVTVKDRLSGKKTHGGRFETEELAQAWIDRQSAKDSQPWGKPERDMVKAEVRHPELIKSSYMAEVEGQQVEMAKVLADYETKIDTEDPNIEIRAKRAREYPPLPMVIEAMIENLEGRPEKLTEVKNWRNMVRTQNPLR